jgi:hypothetical protein
MHLQLSLQKMAAWKHSQYFLRQVDFLQLQPLVWRPASPSREPPSPSVAWILGLRVQGCGVMVCVVCGVWWASAVCVVCGGRVQCVWCVVWIWCGWVLLVVVVVVVVAVAAA